ncbi:MAG: hypothetical protein V4507_09720 [Verrucomicrobiota bacterium]
MNQSIFNTIMVTGFTVAFFHAAIPTHWLPFVLTSRIQKWSRSKTLLITALAGLGHVSFTAILGFLVAWCGITLNAKIGAAFPWIAGGALVLFGSYYVFRQLSGKGHGHTHLFGGHDHGSPKTGVGLRGGVLVDTGHGSLELTVFETGVPPQFRLFFNDEQKRPSSPPACEKVKIETIRPDGERQVFVFQRKADFLESTTDIPEPHEFQAIVTLSHGDHTHIYEVPFTEHDHDHSHHDHGDGHCHHEEKEMPIPKSDWAAIVSLLALLTFSPCEGFLPVYVSGVQYGWSGFFLLTLVLSLATVVGMVVFTAFTLAGMERFKLSFMEKYESGILGGLLVLLGLIIILFET